MQQPSAQGIASLYMGNPQPLQQQIQKEQQAKPGLPPDLQKMLALQIVTNEKDAAAAQMAMQQLKQMSGPTGQMPTVMQTLEQQAQQKLQGQQQPPMGGMMPQGQAPQGQGIDQLPAEFQMAGGGLVSFSGEERSDVPYETAYDRMNRKNRESDTGSSDEPMDPQAKADREKLKRIWAAIKGSSEDAGRAIADVATAVPRGLVGAYDTAVVRPMRAAGVNAAYLSPKVTPEGANPESMTPFSDIKTAREAADGSRAQAATTASNREALNRADAGMRSAPSEAPANDLAALARQKQQAAAPRPPAPVAPRPAAPMAPPPVQAAAPAESEAMGITKAMMRADPAAAKDAAKAEFDKDVGPGDTSQYDRLLAELENRKQALNPKQGYEGLMEALSDISRAGQDPRNRGRGSFASGAAGALLGADRAKENQLQQFELSKQAIEVSQKKLDTVRAYAEKRYGIGKAAFDQVYKDRHDAAKEVVKDESAARKLAQEETLKMLEMKQQATLSRERMRSDEKIAGMRGDAGVERLKLDTIKAQIAAIDKDLAPLLKTPSTDNKAKAVPLQAKKAALMKQLNDTILGAPDAESLGGTTRMRFDAQGNQIK